MWQISSARLLRAALGTHAQKVEQLELYGNFALAKEDKIVKREKASPLISSSYTITSELEAFLVDAQHRRVLSENTITSYRCDLSAASIVIASQLPNVTTAEIEMFLMARDEKPSTTNRLIVSMRRFFLWLIRQGYCQRNPLDQCCD